MNVRKFILALPVLLAISLGVVGIQPPQLAVAQTEDPIIIYFHGNGCSHCAKVDAWFEENDIFNLYPIDDREVYSNRENAAYFTEVMDSLGVPINSVGVPTVVLGELIITGDSPIIEQFITEADHFVATKNIETVTATETDDESSSKLSIWIIIGASLVDAINPCAFAVLLILLSTVLSRKNKKSALVSGLSFSFAIFISYVLMGLGVYSAINAVGATNVVNTAVGVLAIVLGLFNLKDFLWYGKYFKMEVPTSWRPKMQSLIKSVTNPPMAFAIGLLVSLFLLPCTSGPYIVVLGLLADNQFDASTILYLLLYNFIFITPMLLLTVLAYKSADIQKLEYYRKANLERLHLVAGFILIGLGVVILFL